MTKSALTLFTLLFASSAFALSEKEFSRIVFGGTENLAIVENAESVTACVLTPVVALAKTQAGDERITDPNKYKQGSRVTLSPAQVKELKTILLDRTLHDPDVRKACIPIYHVRYTLVSKAGSIDVDLCLQCEILRTSRDGKVVGGEHFDAAGRKLAKLSYTLFPEDEDIKREALYRSR
jgi:hypothetical protein